MKDKINVRKTINEIKGGSWAIAVMFLILGAFITGMITIANIGNSMIPTLGSAAFFGIPLLMILISIMRIEKNFLKMKSALGVESDQEMNELLKDFTSFNDTLFINDKCFVNFNTQKVCFFSDIISISKHHRRYKIRHQVHNAYTISIKTKNSKNIILGFNDIGNRDNVYHMITWSAAFAEASGDTSILSDADND